MKFKTFTILYWGSALLIPFAWLVLGMWDAERLEATKLWLTITGGIYILACIMEHRSNRKQ